MELVALRRKVLEPMMKPTSTAATTAISRPRNQAFIVSPTDTQKAVSPKSATSAAMTSLAGGR